MGPALGESLILRAAYAYEQATEWHKQRPDIKSQISNTKNQVSAV
jgi:hypothetical protein